MPRTLVTVLAGGAGSRLGPLTDGRADPPVVGSGAAITVTARNGGVAEGTEYVSEYVTEEEQ